MLPKEGFDVESKKFREIIQYVATPQLCMDTSFSALYGAIVALLTSVALACDSQPRSSFLVKYFLVHFIHWFHLCLQMLPLGKIIENH